MTGISIAVRCALVGVMALTPVCGAFAQDAFSTFKQLNSTAKMPKLNAFSATNSGPAGIAAKDVVMEAKLTRSEEHTSELQSLMRISYAVFCLTKNTYRHTQ